MVAEKAPYIESAYKQLQIISQDKQKRKNPLFPPNRAHYINLW